MCPMDAMASPARALRGQRAAVPALVHSVANFPAARAPCRMSHSVCSAPNSLPLAALTRSTHSQHSLATLTCNTHSQHSLAALVAPTCRAHTVANFSATPARSGCSLAPTPVAAVRQHAQRPRYLSSAPGSAGAPPPPPSATRRFRIFLCDTRDALRLSGDAPASIATLASSWAASAACARAVCSSQPTRRPAHSKITLSLCVAFERRFRAPKPVAALAAAAGALAGRYRRLLAPHAGAADVDAATLN